MGWFSAAPRIEDLVRDHYEALYRFAYRLSGARAEAEDLAQETFCQAQAKLPQLREPGKARGWLFAILRNAYLQRARAAGAEPKRHSLDDVPEIPDRDEALAYPIDGVALQRALNELPEAYRTPLVLYYFDDFSYRDIADQLGVPMGTVMSRLARAKEHLRGRLSAPTAEPIREGTR